jgi:hypothetical protein
MEPFGALFEEAMILATKKFPVIADFKDNLTGEIVSAGDIIEVEDEEREDSLRAAKVIGKELIDPAENLQYPHHVGGGTFLLSNGEKVKGKEAAETEQAKLDVAVEQDADNSQ